MLQQRWQKVVFVAALLAVASTQTLQDVADRRGLISGTVSPEPRRAPSTLFCFVLVMPFGYEAGLLAAQQREGVGVFGCNSHLVFSNVSGPDLFGKQAAAIHTSVINGPVQVPRSDEPGKAYLNTGIFIKVWNQLFKDARFEQYDWTLKVDVDTIMVPALLRGLLLIHCEPQECRPLYLRDTSGNISGPIEVLSRAGMKYFASYGSVCEKQLHYGGLNEAQYLSLCLNQLSVPAEQEPNLLLQVESKGKRRECDNMHAAFHPFKSWELSLPCLEQAGLRIFKKPPVEFSSTGPSLFCFAVVHPNSYETMLVAEQFLAGVGIYTCDDYRIFSNVSSKELFKEGFRPPRWPAIGPEVSEINGSMAVPLGGRYLTPLNADIFIKVWRKIFDEAMHKHHDWTLKFDTDAVFLPGRLRELLWSVCPISNGECGSVYVENPGRYMRGPVEALSRMAVEALVQGEIGCRGSLDTAQLGEDQYTQQCLGQLQVPSMQLPELLGAADPVVMAKPDCSTRRAVYHPFKVWDEYMGCLAKAGYILPGPVGERDGWTLSGDAELAEEQPSMLCWALVLPVGQEPALLLRQMQEGVGIFSCDAHLAISNASLEVAFGAPAKKLKTAVIDAYLFTPRGGKYFTALNSPVFIKAWHEVFRDGRFRNHDWTVKFDADAVIVPHRVRALLGKHCPPGEECRSKYLANFGGDLHGPVEALSRKAMETYALGEMQCKTEVDYSDKGEDWYLGLCLELLEIPGEQEPSLLSDWHLDQGTPSPCDTLHATFHPFKTWDNYVMCLCQSGYRTDSCDRLMQPTTVTATITSTSTSTTQTTTTRTTETSATTKAATTRTALSLTESTQTRTSTSRASVIIFDGPGRVSDHVRGQDSGPPKFLRGLLPPALRHSHPAPLALVAVGIIGAAGIAALILTMSHKFRAKRIEGVLASPVPTSPTHSAETTTTLAPPYSAVGTDPPGSSDELLRSSRGEATAASSS